MDGRSNFSNLIAGLTILAKYDDNLEFIWEISVPDIVVRHRFEKQINVSVTDQISLAAMNWWYCKVTGSWTISE